MTRGLTVLPPYEFTLLSNLKPQISNFHIKVKFLTELNGFSSSKHITTIWVNSYDKTTPHNKLRTVFFADV